MDVYIGGRSSVDMSKQIQAKRIKLLNKKYIKIYFYWKHGPYHFFEPGNLNKSDDYYSTAFSFPAVL